MPCGRHKIKRKVRSTLTAECAAANECLEASDRLRSHLVELLEGRPLNRREWRQNVRAVPKSLVTDSRSMFDFLNKRGSTPSDKRLWLDLEMIRDEMDDEGLKVKWVNTHQQLADALTKGSLDASMYLMMVARSAKYALTVDERLSEEVAEFKKQRRYEEQEVRNRKRRVMAEYKRKQQKHKEDAGGDTVMKDAGGKDAGGDIEMKDAEMKQADGDVEMGDADDDDAMQVGDLCVALVQALVAAVAVIGSAVCLGGGKELAEAGKKAQKKAEADEKDETSYETVESECGSAWEQIVEHAEKEATSQAASSSMSASSMHADSSVPAGSMPAGSSSRMPEAQASTEVSHRRWDGRRLPPFSSTQVLVPQPLHRVTTKVNRRWLPQYVATQREGDCTHPREALSTHGTNQVGQRIRCMACGKLLQQQKLIKDHMITWKPG